MNFLFWCEKTKDLTIEEWGRGFFELEEKVKSESAAKQSSFTPSYAEFIGLCRKPEKEYGLPSEINAFNEARKEAYKAPNWRKWSHNAVYIATQATGFFDIQTLADNDKMYHDVKKRFLEHYRDAVAKVMAGEKLEIPPENRVEAPTKGWNKTRSEKANKYVMGNMRGMFDD